MGDAAKHLVTVPSEGHEDSGTRPTPLDLLLTFQDLVTALKREVDAGHWLDAYLLAAGANQTIEDHVNRDAFALVRAASFLRKRQSPALSPPAGAAMATARILAQLRRLAPQTHRLVAHQQRLAEVTTVLAEIVTDGQIADDSRRGDVRAYAAICVGSLATLPDVLRSRVGRLPACFRSFDQQPEDMDRLVGMYLARRPSRSQRLLVIGLRTSGSYLAPLVAASLKSRGCTDTQWITVRPDRPWLQDTRHSITGSVRRGGRILVVDDPPSSGSSLLAVTSDLVRADVPADKITLLLALLGSADSLPESLRGQHSVLLHWEDWAIHAKLSPPAVRRALAAFLPTRLDVEFVERRPLTAEPGRRGHTSALYEARTRDKRTGRRDHRLVFVEGCGLGYLGRHTQVVAAALHGLVPEVYGQDAGLLYREWLPGCRRHAHAAGGDPGPDVVAEYVVRRHRALAVDLDHSRSLAGQTPVWEVASEILGRAYGRLGVFLRLPILDGVAKRLLRVSEPSVIDGRMAPSQWFDDPLSDLGMRKIGFAARAFSNLDLACYDSVFDMAVAALDGAGTSAAEQFRLSYERRTQRDVDGERWLLYLLVHLWDVERLTPDNRNWARRAAARCVQNYFRGVYFADVTPPASGELCAVDIDGVLENSELGFSCPTPAGAAALRALLLHGYRPVLVTGRSLNEVRERCLAYQLPGGVAEYGAAVFLSAAGEVIDLLSAGDRAVMTELRAALEARDGVAVDADYVNSVRAYRAKSGVRSCLDEATIASALEACGHADSVSVLHGEGQTDFVANGINKGRGLRLLAARLGGELPGEDAQVALSVGDSKADASMFAESRLSLAPRNADLAVRQSGVPVLNGYYQKGLAEAVSQVIGHRPLKCFVCSTGVLSKETRLLLTALSAQENGIRSVPLQVARLAGLALSGFLR